MSFNLACMLREVAGDDPDKAVALFDGGSLTYGALDVESDRLAIGLQQAGIGPGLAVGVQLPNISEFLDAYFGATTTSQRRRRRSSLAGGSTPVIWATSTRTGSSSSWTARRSSSSEAATTSTPGR